jgi:GAF domain-containing protein
MTVGGEVIGILRFLSKTARQFQGDEIEFAAALAERCGVALENAAAYEKQERQLSYFKALNEIGKAVNAGLSLREVLDFMVQKLPAVMKVKGCTIRLMNQRLGRLELMAASGLSKAYLSRGSIDDEIGTHRALQGEPVAVGEVGRDERIGYRCEAEEEGIHSILAVPIIVQGNIIGVLRLLSDAPRDFDDVEIAFTAAAAEHGGIAIRNAENLEKIQKLLTELEQHEEFLHQVVDGMGQDLLVLEASGRTAMANKSFTHRRGYNEQHFIGMPYSEAAPFLRPEIFPWDRIRQSTKPHIFTAELGGEAQQSLEITASPVFIYGGDKADFVIVTMRDVTDKERLRREQLERTRLEGVLEMAGAVSHEVNSPLFSALGTAELLKEDLADNVLLSQDVDVIIKNLKTISELTKRIAGITSYEAMEYAGGTKIVDISKA